jgi:hypothetical protein
MKYLNKQSIIGLIVAAIGMGPVTSLADSGIANAASPSVAVDLKFKVVIPGTMRFRVGTDAAGTVDEVLFEPLAADIGNGGDVTASTNGTVTVSIFSNAGQVTITPTNDTVASQGLTNVAGDDIPYDEILVSESSAGFLNPTLSNAGGVLDATTPTPTSGNNKVTSYPGESWSYLYDNVAAYPAGDYTGTVTYTATSP